MCVLVENLKFDKDCAKFVPEILSDNKRQFCIECCNDIVDMMVPDSGFLNKVMTCNESWAFICSPESRIQSAKGKHMNSPRPKKEKMSRWQEKAMVIPLFDSQRFICFKCVPQGLTINKEYYLKILKKKFREKMREKKPQQWSSGGSTRTMLHATSQRWRPPGWPTEEWK